ncbi:MAG: hypothetical protein QXE31_05145, partial [Candidatus Woesearchaeota archaeon]
TNNEIKALTETSSLMEPFNKEDIEIIKELNFKPTLSNTFTLKKFIYARVKETNSTYTDDFFTMAVISYNSPKNYYTNLIKRLNLKYLITLKTDLQSLKNLERIKSKYDGDMNQIYSNNKFYLHTFN